MDTEVSGIGSIRREAKCRIILAVVKPNSYARSPASAHDAAKQYPTSSEKYRGVMQ